ncbi:hypothetical protein IU485_27810 [Nocardia cyriacigeorgica]|uniref:hypothetical protein n=1 Tax=Nocardia cyriacigeorgica TaxID=135487 RepID=UPI001893D563|nr:hypothetical protein [Nocardia cyriacigeorgica]MBF6085184.1 hypothetical protein [Nocardia cyriacigeorgica]
MAKAKTPYDHLAKIADGKRFTRDEVQEVLDTGDEWVENLTVVFDKLEAIENFDFDIETEGLDEIGSGAFSGLSEAADRINDAKSKAEEIRGFIEEFTSNFEEFTGHADTWMDEDADKDDRADAREQMADAATEIRDRFDDLRGEGVDPEATP